MAKYILKRLGYIIIVFFLLSILLFGILKWYLVILPDLWSRDKSRVFHRNSMRCFINRQEYVSDLINRFGSVFKLDGNILQEISVTLPYIVFRLKN